MVDTSTAGIVPVPKRLALAIPRRELSEDVSFGIVTGPHLVVEQIELGKSAPGGKFDENRREVEANAALSARSK